MRPLGNFSLLLICVFAAYALSGLIGAFAGASMLTWFQHAGAVPAGMTLQRMLSDPGLAEGPLSQPHFATVGALFAANGLTLIVFSVVGMRLFGAGSLWKLLTGWHDGLARWLIGAIFFLPAVLVASFAIVFWLAGLSLPAERGIDFAAWHSWLYLASLVVAAPVAEEVAFRGLLQTGLAQHVSNQLLVIAIVAVAWALIHLSQGGAKTLALVPVGVALSWLRAQSGSLLPGLAGHMAMNAAGLAIMILLANNQ